MERRRSFATFLSGGVSILSSVFTMELGKKSEYLPLSALPLSAWKRGRDHAAVGAESDGIDSKQVFSTYRWNNYAQALDLLHRLNRISHARIR